MNALTTCFRKKSQQTTMELYRKGGSYYMPLAHLQPAEFVKEIK